MSTTTTQTQTEAPLEASIKKLQLSGSVDSTAYKYADFLPGYSTSLKQAPLEPFEHHDPGHAALKDTNPRSFLDGAKVNNLTPKFGTSIEGVDLTKLDAAQRSQLALYVAQRGFAVFRDNQAFIDADPQWQIYDWAQTFGRIHIHPVSGQPAKYPELHLVYRDDATTTDERAYDGRLNKGTLHSDVSYELQPPGLTTLFLYNTPESGGDTLFVSATEAYNRLSPSFAAYLETLEVEHSGFEQAARAIASKGADTVKRQPVKHIHPLIRRHPVTGDKSLYVNPGFSRRIIGLKQEESEAILGLLYQHLLTGHDFSARAKWEPGSVVLWDNRVTSHSAIVDWGSELKGFRHGARLTPQAERPTL